MAGIHAQPHIQGSLCRCSKTRELGALLCRAPGRCVGLGIELNTVGPHGLGCGHGARLGIHEQTHPQAQRVGIVNQRLETHSIVGEHPTMVAGELALRVGHKGYLVHRQTTLAQVAHTAHEVVEGVPFHVVFAVRPSLQQLGQIQHVLRTNMARIGPRVHRNTRRTGLQAQRGRARDAGDAQVAGVAHQGNFVEVD